MTYDSSIQNTIDKYHTSIQAELLSGDSGFALRLIARMITEMSTDKPPGSLQEPPTVLPDIRFDKLFKTAVKYALITMCYPVPHWTETEALHPIWFPYCPSTDAYRELIIRETPPVFSQTGIFIRERSLLAV